MPIPRLIPIEINRLPPESRPNDITFDIPYVRAEPSIYRSTRHVIPPTTISMFAFNLTQLIEALNTKIGEIEERGFQTKLIVVNYRIERYLKDRYRSRSLDSRLILESFGVSNRNVLEYYGIPVLASESMPMDGYFVT